MQIKTPTRFEPFMCGRCLIGAIDSGRITVRAERNFDDRVIGSKRYYTAVVANRSITRVIRIPRTDVEEADVVVIGDAQYRVGQVQHIPDTNPPSTDLTLEILRKTYEVVR